MGTKVRANQVFGVSGFPKAYLSSILPIYMQPNTNQSFVITGSFFTPNTTVSIGNQTIENITFVSSNEITIDVIWGATEGEFDITINNGIPAVFSKVFIVSLGEVLIPSQSDWTETTGSLNRTTAGEIKLTEESSVGYSVWEIGADQEDFQIRVAARLSPYETDFPYSDGGFWAQVIRTDTNEIIGRVSSWYYIMKSIRGTLGLTGIWNRTDDIRNYGYSPTPYFIIERVNGFLKLKKNDGSIVSTSASQYNGPVKIGFQVVAADMVGIKYIKI